MLQLMCHMQLICHMQQVCRLLCLWQTLMSL